MQYNTIALDDLIVVTMISRILRFNFTFCPLLLLVLAQNSRTYVCHCCDQLNTLSAVSVYLGSVISSSGPSS